MAKRRRTRRQHIVSGFYLREFAQDRGYVHRVELPGTNRLTLSMTNAGVVKDFYTLDLPDGTKSDVFEKLFAGIEDLASHALRAVVHEHRWPLVGEQREALAYWIALQHLRSEGIRASQLQVRAQMIRMIVGVSGKERLRRYIAESEGRPIGAEELDQEWNDLTKSTGPDLEPEPEEHLRMLLEFLPGTTDLLSASNWTLFRFERRTLITCDHPVSLVAHPNASPFGGVGLATASAFVMPLSRRVGLLMLAPGQDSTPEVALAGTTQSARFFIGQTIGNARRFLYHNPDDDPLTGLVLPARRPQEIRFGGDALIREEGLFPNMEEWSDEEQRSWEAIGSLTDAESSFSLHDLPWPIPNRKGSDGVRLE